MRALLQSRQGVGIAVAAACLCLASTAFAGSPITTNPANRAVLLSQPIEDLNYDDSKRCLPDAQPGTLALEAWLARHWRGESWGIVRCSKLSPGEFSVHAEGRALDWHLDAGDGAERRAAMRLIEMLLASDREGNETALARRMGVQGLIFDCRSWYGYADRLAPYSYCYRRDGRRRKHLNRTLAHRDHVHIELNWAGARKQTSFWRSPLAP
jgi:hypothetical protein